MSKKTASNPTALLAYLQKKKKLGSPFNTHWILWETHLPRAIRVFIVKSNSMHDYGYAMLSVLVTLMQKVLLTEMQSHFPSLNGNYNSKERLMSKVPIAQHQVFWRRVWIKFLLHCQNIIFNFKLSIAHPAGRSINLDCFWNIRKFRQALPCKAGN